MMKKECDRLRVGNGLEKKFYPDVEEIEGIEGIE